MMEERLIFNPPPGWPKPPSGWIPPKGWTPDPTWPPPPEGWVLWVPASDIERNSPANGPTPIIPNNCKSIPTPPSDWSQNIVDLQRRLAILETENSALRSQLSESASGFELVILDDDQVLQEVGIYRYHHPLENSSAYKEKLSNLSSKIADLVKAKCAIQMSNLFTYDNSLAKGRQMSNDLGKLMLRAYNAEADNCLRSLRAGNVVTAKKRIEASRSAIKKLGRMMEMQISDEYHSLRMEELELTSDYLMKKQEEKEAAAEERARLREERKVEAELAAEREKLDREKLHIIKTLEILKQSGESDSGLELRLAELEDAITQNDFRTANIRAGYVYVISNRGAFGKKVVKIGLTRRLEPLDRVNELGGASVPFRFDVHALFFSEDAVSLETALHHHFSDRRVNHANNRKEFFFASPSEVRAVLISKVGNLLEFCEHPESTEFLQSVRYWPQEFIPPVTK